MMHFRNGFEGHRKEICLYIQLNTEEAVLFFSGRVVYKDIMIQRRQRICFYSFSSDLFSFCLQLTATKIVMC